MLLLHSTIYAFQAQWQQPALFCYPFDIDSVGLYEMSLKITEGIGVFQ